MNRIRGSRRNMLMAVGLAGLLISSASLAFAAPAPLDDVFLNGGGATFPSGGTPVVWDIGNAENAYDQCATWNNPTLEVDANLDGSSDAFDGGVSFVIGTTPFYDSDGTGNATTTRVVAGPELFGPLKGTLTHQAFDDESVLRSTLTLKNTSNKAQTRYLIFDSAHGTDMASRMTSDGDLAWEGSDRWALFSDYGTSLSRPFVAYALHGKGKPASPVSNILYRPWESDTGDGEDCVTVDYKVRIPAGAARHLVVFTMLIDDDAPASYAMKQAARFNKTSLDLWRGMSKSNRAKVVNWDL